MSNSVNLSLDVTKTGIQNPLVKIRQGDGGFETLRTTVTANGEPMDLQGWIVTFMGTTAGNHKIVDTNVKMVEASNGIFDYTPSKAWGMDVGEFKVAYFKFVKGDGVASSANFRVNVIEAVDLTQEEAQHYISVVDATIAEVNNHLTTVSNNLTTLGNRINDYNSKLADLNVGGRNLFLNSKSLWGAAVNAGASYTIEDYDANTKMWHITAPAGNATGSTGIYFSYTANVSTPLMSGDEWVMSIDIKGAGRLSRFGMQLSSLTSPSGTVPTDWTRMHSSGVMRATSADAVIYFNTSTTPLDVYVKLPKLEKGNVPTDWTPAPEDADSRYVKKAGDAMTGQFQVGGNAGSGEAGVQIRPQGNMELSATTPFIDFHGNNSTGDYTSRLWDTAGGLWLTANGQNNNLTQVLANAANPINIDTMIGGVPSLTGVGQSVRVHIDNLTPDGTIPAGLSKWSVLTHLATNSGTAWQEIWDVVSTSIWRRTRSGSPAKYSAWEMIAKDSNVVHKTGNETIAGDKTFTGNTTLSTTTVLAGNYGLRVTTSGIQKTTDGKTWVPANI